jgi:uncharacterized protein YndB with AHSA1/START domain
MVTEMLLKYACKIACKGNENKPLEAFTIWDLRFGICIFEKVMPDIYHTFTINSSPGKIFACFTSPPGLDKWWTKTSKGKPAQGAVYTLDFGPGYIWKAKVISFDKDRKFEWEMTEADAEWVGTKIGFLLVKKNATSTEVSFYHTGWPKVSENFRQSNYCWAMYLRILKRYIEYGEIIPYEKRLAL